MRRQGARTRTKLLPHTVGKRPKPEGTAITGGETPDVLGSVEFVRGQRQRVGMGLGEVGAEFAGRLRRIDMQQYAPLGGNDSDVLCAVLDVTMWRPWSA